MGAVEIGAMPTSDGVMRGSPEIDFEERPRREDLLDGKGGKIRIVNGLRNRKGPFAGEARNLIDGRYHYCRRLAPRPPLFGVQGRTHLASLVS